jgi:ABC-type lipoprotein release transport system permease subunit
LYGVSPFEPGVYLLVVGSLGTMSLLAAAVPAVRAMRVSPGEVLRGQ